MKIKLFAVLVGAAILLAACAPVATEAPTPVPTEVLVVEEPKTIVDIAVEDGRFTTLVTALQAAELVDTLSNEGPYTVFAPTDDAFAALPAGTLDSLLLPENRQQLTDILLYHVLSGSILAADVVALDGQQVETGFAGNKISIKVDMGAVYLNDTVKVIITDIVASNGVIHVIDAVLLPPAEEAVVEKDIVETAVADGRFTTLVAALQAAGLVETLQGDGPFTVFAPTDDAFAALPAGTLDSLLLPENKQQLVDILLYHVVPGSVLAADVVGLDGQLVDTALAGKQLAVKVDMGSVYLNDTVKVIITDIVTRNGVIHVIDAVLLP